MRRSTLLLTLGSVAVLASALAFWLGVHWALNLGVMLDSVPKGAMALHHLNALDSRKTHNMRVALEGDVDMALLWAYRTQQHPLGSLAEPLWGYPLKSHDEYLRRLADYRATHRSPMHSEALAKQPAPEDSEKRAFREYLLEGARENDAIIELMVKRYSTAKDAQH